METGRDVVEMFFNALATPKKTVVAEYLTNGWETGIIDTTTTKE